MAASGEEASIMFPEQGNLFNTSSLLHNGQVPAGCYVDEVGEVEMGSGPRGLSHRDVGRTVFCEMTNSG